MSRAFWILNTLLKHWRRHPANLATLITGLAVATALWSGVQALNQQARASYDRAAALFSGGAVESLVPARGATFARESYVSLRRKGAKVSPVLEGSVRINGKALRVLGIEPLSLPQRSNLSRIEGVKGVGTFLTPPWEAMVARETLGDLRLQEGERPLTETGRPIPPLKAAPDMLPGLVIVDIAVAEALLGKPGRISRLLVDPIRGDESNEIVALSNGVLRRAERDEAGDLARLTDSFHLNLTAFGLLAFIVGLFIVHSAMGLAFEQRLAVFRTMRAIGLSLRMILVVLIGELVVLALAAGTIGLVLGYAVAAFLLPNVALSLEGLYGAQIPGVLTLAPAWWLSGLGMAVVGSFLSGVVTLHKAYRLPLLAVAHRMAWRTEHERLIRRYGLLGGGGVLSALVAYVIGQGLLAGFIVIAGIFLGAALLLPLLLSLLLAFGETRARGPLSQWLFADARLALPGLSLALMAMLLALAANIGVGTMVEGFRKTFTAWLDERLVSEVYFDATTNEDALGLVDWLGKRPEVRAILPFWRAETRLARWPVDVIGFTDHETYRAHLSLLAALPLAWDRVASGDGVLISEQLARRAGLALGERLEVPGSEGSWSGEVVGIFPDYGNPKGQIRLALDVFTNAWPEARRTSFSLRLSPGASASLIRDMSAAFSTGLSRVVDQASVKEMSTGIFDQTFAVTAALNVLTLLVSSIALLASLLTLGNMRVEQVAPVWAVGVARRGLVWLELLKVLTLAALTAVLAIPLGLVLAWCLVAIVNVRAFGWELPFHIFPGQWLRVTGLAIGVAVVAALLPLIRLGRMPPADLLKVFADER